MKRIVRSRLGRIIVVLAQMAMLVVCAVCLVAMSAGESSLRAGVKTEEQESTGNPGEESVMSKPLEKEDWIEETPASNEGGDVAADMKPATEELFKANLRLPLEDRVKQLLGNTSLYSDGVIRYEDLLSKKTTWSVRRVLIRFDELAAIYLAALKETAPRTKGGRLLSVKTETEGNTVAMTLEIGFTVTNGVLKLFMGGGEQVVNVRMTAAPKGDSIAIQSIVLSGNKEYADSTVRLGSDFLFGTEDYLTFVSDVAERVTRSLGRVVLVDDTRYGVVFDTVTTS